MVFSADDWCGNSFIDSKFQQACDMFTSKRIWLSVAIITQGFRNDQIWRSQPPPIWSHIQDKIDKGYIEIVSHSVIASGVKQSQEIASPAFDKLAMTWSTEYLPKKIIL